MKKIKRINIQVFQIILTKIKTKEFKVSSFKILNMKIPRITKIETAYTRLKLMMKDKIVFLLPSQIKQDIKKLIRIYSNNQYKISFSIKD